MSKNLKLNINRERLREAIVYFSKYLKYPTITMMYKVLASLDFEHFKETGLPVTNLVYQAWKRGPVPYEFDKEISDRKNDCVLIPDDFASALKCIKEEWETENGQKRKSLKFHAKRKPNLEVFTSRQIKILEKILFIYKNETPSTASKASHEKDTPWYKNIKKKGKQGEIIKYLDLLDDKSKITKEEAIEMVRELSAFQLNYGT
jgi:uncharacterized phage-associated protein